MKRKNRRYKGKWENVHYYNFWRIIDIKTFVIRHATYNDH